MIGTGVELRERPIIFSGESIRGILEGRKIQTRRVVRFPKWVKEEDKLKLALQKPATGLAEYVDGVPRRKMTCSYGQVGDRLWVRETWWQGNSQGFGKHCVVFDVDKEPRWIKGTIFDYPDLERDFKKRTSIFMPRWASRITLEIRDIRVEKLHEIYYIDKFGQKTDSGAWKEGIRCPNPIEGFEKQWNALNKKRGYEWEINPWVWVIEFERI